MFNAYFLLIMKTPRHHWVLWNTNVHYCVQRRPPLAPVTRQINPLHKIHINIIVPSVSSLWSGFFTFPTKILYNILLLSMLISPPSYYFFPRRPKYRPQHSSPENSQPLFLSTPYEIKFRSYIHTDKSTVVYILIFIFWNSKRERRG
jgi:hypothetical protein